jgi:hypothetical protein
VRVPSASYTATQTAHPLTDTISTATHSSPSRTPSKPAATQA